MQAAQGGLFTLLSYSLAPSQFQTTFCTSLSRVIEVGAMLRISKPANFKVGFQFDNFH